MNTAPARPAMEAEEITREKARVAGICALAALATTIPGIRDCRRVPSKQGSRGAEGQGSRGAGEKTYA